VTISFGLLGNFKVGVGSNLLSFSKEKTKDEIIFNRLCQISEEKEDNLMIHILKNKHHPDYFILIYYMILQYNESCSTECELNLPSDRLLIEETIKYDNLQVFKRLEKIVFYSKRDIQMLFSYSFPVKAIEYSSFKVFSYLRKYTNKKYSFKNMDKELLEKALTNPTKSSLKIMEIIFNSTSEYDESILFRGDIIEILRPLINELLIDEVNDFWMNMKYRFTKQVYTPLI
jgi:hypothetical protein